MNITAQPITETAEKNTLYDLIEFYDSSIASFTYSYQCKFGTNITFSIEPEKVCHLLFGTLKDKNLVNSNEYKGIKGYTNIKDKTITEVPNQLKRAFKSKSPAFSNLDKLLANPTVIYFNQNLATSNGIKTRIPADFLLYKQIGSLKVHLFLQWIEREKRFVPISTFHNKENGYTKDQIELKIISKTKYLKNN